MPYLDDENGPLTIVNLVDDAVIPDADAPTIAARELPASLRARIARQTLYGIAHTREDRVIEIAQLTLRPRQDQKGPHYWRRISISRKA